MKDGMSGPILLLGQHGQVARELQRELSTLGELVVVGRTPGPGAPGLQADLARPDTLTAVVDAVRPALIVNAAAYTAVDRAESEVELAFAVNAEAPAVLAQAACRHGALLVHYSTDYVFDGRAQHPYREDDATAPQGVYGCSKRAGEEAIVASGCAHLIFRTSWVYGLHGQNFMRTMRRLARERDTLRVVADQVGAPTWSRHIAQATAQVLAQLRGQPASGEPAGQGGFDRGFDAARGAACSGVYHLVSSGRCSWFEFAQAIIAHQRGHEALAVREVVPIATHEYPLPAARPAWSVLDAGKLADTFGVRLPDWTTALAQVQQELDREPI